MAIAKGMATVPRGHLRPLAWLVCALALGLLAWRGAAILTGPGAAVSASPPEAALADVLAPVAGPGLSRVSITRNPDGGRTVLLLLDETASARLPDLQRIAATAAGINAAEGDKLVIETLSFAAGLPGRPDMAAAGELLALLALALAGGAIAWLAGGASHASAAPVQVVSPAPAPLTERAPEPVRALRAVPAAAPPEGASDIVRRDPKRAAAVLRTWMSAKDDPA